MIALPPFDGAVQLTVADAFPAVAVTPVGAAGAVAGAGGEDDVDPVVRAQLKVLVGKRAGAP